jgi:hypothetical protein
MAISTFIRRTAAIGAAALALSGAVAGQAMASVPRTTAPSHLQEKQGMHVTGFDAAVAQAHGYKIVTYANGDRQAVPVNPRSGLPKGTLLVKASATGGTIRPENGGADTAYGNCGESWITALQTGAHQIKLTSGFEVDLPAVKFDWDIDLTDINGTSEQGDSGYLAEDEEWEGTWSKLDQYDFSVDVVRAGAYAILTDGEICYSGEPAIDWDLD